MFNHNNNKYNILFYYCIILINVFHLQKKKENTTWERINYKNVQVNSHIYPICIISLYIAWVRISILVLHIRSNQYTEPCFRFIISVVNEMQTEPILISMFTTNFFLNTIKIATSPSTASNHRTPHTRRGRMETGHLSLFKPVA